MRGIESERQAGEAEQFHCTPFADNRPDFFETRGDVSVILSPESAKGVALSRRRRYLFQADRASAPCQYGAQEPTDEYSNEERGSVARDVPLVTKRSKRILYSSRSFFLSPSFTLQSRFI